MEFSDVLHTLGASLTLALGLLGLARPRAAGRLLGLAAGDAAGRAGLRAVVGGVLVGLGAFALWAEDVVAYAAVGAAWLGAAATRLASASLDDARDPASFAAVIASAVLALLLLA